MRVGFRPLSPVLIDFRQAWPNPLDIVRTFVLRLADLAARYRARVYATPGGDERCATDDAPLFILGSGKRQRRQILLALVLPVAGAAQSDQVRRIVIAALSERLNMVHVKRPLVFLRRLAALLAYPVTLAHHASQLGPVTAVSSHASGIDARRFPPFSFPSSHVFNGEEKALGSIGVVVTDSHRVGRLASTKACDVAPCSLALGAGMNPTKPLAGTTLRPTVSEGVNAASTNHTSPVAYQTHDRHAPQFQAIVTSHVGLWLALDVTPTGVVLRSDSGLAAATTLAKTIRNCIVRMRHFWSSTTGLEVRRAPGCFRTAGVFAGLIIPDSVVSL